jgi:hypothetical protein
VNWQVSRDQLVRLLGTPTGFAKTGHVRVKGPTLDCLSTGRARGDRTGAWCVSPTTGDISCTMVLNGWAAKWNYYWKSHQCR